MAYMGLLPFRPQRQQGVVMPQAAYAPALRPMVGNQKQAGNVGQGQVDAPQPVRPQNGSPISIYQSFVTSAAQAIDDATTAISIDDAAALTLSDTDQARTGGKKVRQVTTTVGLSGDFPAGWDAQSLSEQIYGTMSVNLVQGINVVAVMLGISLRYTQFNGGGVDFPNGIEPVSGAYVGTRFTVSATVPAADTGETYSVVIRFALNWS